MSSYRVNSSGSGRSQHIHARENTEWKQLVAIKVKFEEIMRVYVFTMVVLDYQ